MFLYDGVNAVQELSGSTVTANLLTGLGVDEIFTRTDSGGARDFLRDGLGSTLALTDSSGTTQTQYTYEPFGNTTTSGNASASTFQYTGRENDGTGLYDYRARYYSPIFQRFISEDPLGWEGSGVNLYSYVFDNPIGYTDPSGEDVKFYFWWDSVTHVGVGVNSDPSQGFYPLWPKMPYSPGVLVPDSTRQNGPADTVVTIPTGPVQDRSVQDYLKRRQLNPGRFKFPGRDCTSVPNDILKQLGRPVQPDPIPENLMKQLLQQGNAWRWNRPGAPQPEDPPPFRAFASFGALRAGGKFIHGLAGTSCE
jgi:RHS repeat-associated protein